MQRFVDGILFLSGIPRLTFRCLPEKNFNVEANNVERQNVKRDHVELAF